MQFIIERTSDRTMVSDEAPAPGAVLGKDGQTWHIEIASLEELTAMIDTLEEPLILSRRRGPQGPTVIEIYDDMREEFA
jgi:hypothetical protein